MSEPRHRLLSVLGSRPDIIQAAPLSLALAGRLDEVLVHTGQHYDPSLSELQIADLRLPVPDYNLGVGSLPDARQLQLAQHRIAEVIGTERPDAVLVRGDTNAALAAARAATDHGLPLLHVEAGLRSYRKDMPEERNRMETDQLSDVLFAPTPGARDTLLEENVRGAVYLTGDVLADVFFATSRRLPERSEPGDYLLATVHRNYNTDDPGRLGAVLDCLAAAPCRVILPLHPRTGHAMDSAGLEAPGNVELRGPVTYTEMLALERDAVAIATDSGGVQREAYLQGVPCITLREESEWVETVETGWSTLVGVDPEQFRVALERPRPLERPAVFGEGRASEAIAELTVTHLHELAEAFVA
jgi:UDP-N-acetylglucosamine 2-epimerase